MSFFTGYEPKSFGSGMETGRTSSRNAGGNPIAYEPPSTFIPLTVGSEQPAALVPIPEDSLAADVSMLSVEDVLADTLVPSQAGGNPLASENERLKQGVESLKSSPEHARTQAENY